MKTRYIACIALVVLVNMLVCVAAFSLDEWPMFRQNGARTGAVLNADGSGVLAGNRPVPIWVYPIVEPAWDQNDESAGLPTGTNGWTIDNLDAVPQFDSSGDWTTGTVNAIDPYGKDYLWTVTDGVRPDGTVPTFKWAKWSYDFSGNHTLKTKSGKVSFYIYAWIPAPGNNETPMRTADAHYTVLINSVPVATVILDQRNGGGWIQLGGRPFAVSPGDVLDLKLTNQTEELDAAGLPAQRTVIADAVYIKQYSGSVVSSPACVPNPNAVSDSDLNVLVGCSITKTSLADTGSSGAVRSLGWITGIGTEPDSNIAVTTDDRGIMKWQFPASDHNWISNGITASPTINSDNGANLVAVPALDRQVYVIDPAKNYTNDIAVPVWQGPGYMLWNPTTTTDGTEKWIEGLHAGYQQNPKNAGETRYFQVKAIAPVASGFETNRAVAEWDQTVNPRVDRSYTIEVWIPPTEGSEIYITDAKYHVEVTDGGGLLTKQDVQVDQRNGAMWVQLGGDYYLPASGSASIKVTLMNETNMDQTNQTFWVAADAMRVLPADLGQFDFSSALVKTSGTNTNIYVGSVSGRIYKLTLDDPEPVWTYPAANMPPMGSIYASITEANGYLYCGSQDGHLYCLNMDGSEKWVYPSLTADPPMALAEISSTTAIGDFIYVATGAYHAFQMGWQGSSAGRVVAIKDDPKLGPQLQWVYPSISNDPAGAFVYGSPLWMAPSTTDPNGVYIGSTDGYFYGCEAIGDSGTLSTIDKWPKIDVGASMQSSPAGTMAQFNDPQGNVRNAPIGIAFVDSGSNISAVDISVGKKEGWEWGLMGSSISSPAVYRHRIYTGDMGGFVWAFSTGDSAGGAESWNQETGMTGPPTAGSEDTGGTNPGRQAVPLIDVFTKEDYDAFLAAAELSRTGLKDIATVANGFTPDNPPHPVTKGPPIIREWGEDTYIIVWNILDPNEKDKDPANWKTPKDTGFLGGIEGGHNVKISIQSRESGANAGPNGEPLSGQKIGWYQGADGYAHWYAAYTYVLGGSSSSDAQTPSAKLNIGVEEQPMAPDKKSPIVWIADTTSKNTPPDPQIFSINNPLALIYDQKSPGYVPYGGQGPWDVGVDTSLQTFKTDGEAQRNGNMSVPMVWGGITPHNKPSQQRTITVCDRSLLGMNMNTNVSPPQPSRQITRFRMERWSLAWTGDGDFTSAKCKVVNPIPAWDEPPQDVRTNRPNTSHDYPNISVRQVDSVMTSGGQDPTQSPQDLSPEIDSTVTKQNPPNDTAKWTIRGNGVRVVVNVPRFQPANMPTDPNNPSLADLQTSGYTGGIFAYVDSNGNGVFDRPAGLGYANINSNAEAYRVLSTQVHVPVDRRVDLQPERINLGELPHGFGYTDKAGVPYPFTDTLMYNLDLSQASVGCVSPPGFAQWFKTFQASNVGNTNLLNVAVERTNLTSDTVQYPSFDPSTTPMSLMPGSGSFIPYYCVISTTDGPIQNRTPFFDPTTGIPPVASTLPANQRTFHKPRVGGTPTPLRLPDVPDRKKGQFQLHIPNDPGQGPQFPAIGVALPLGIPAGTYVGKVRLDEANPSNPQQPFIALCDPIEIVVKATDSRLTDGYTLDAPLLASHAASLPHLDLPSQQGTGDAMPAAYRDRSTGNVHLYWTSSRNGGTTSGSGSVTPTAADPWYLYKSTLFTDPQVGPGKPGSWIEPTGIIQWWKPNSILPNPSSVPSYFPGPPLGAAGTVVPGSVRFSSPSVMVNESDSKSWLLFEGQAYKDDPAAPADKRKTLESRLYYADIAGDTGDPGTVYSISAPDSSGANIAGDWTTPKFGVKGIVLKPNASSQMWCFWYGGSADRWRIYYSANPTPSDHTKWTNEAPLPLPKGLSSAAEPSPVSWWHRVGATLATDDTFDMTYSAYSVFHRNSDIYLSRYKTDPTPATAAKGGYWPVTLQLLPQRRGVSINVNGSSIMCDKLTRDVTRGAWYSRDVDWDASIMSFTDKTGANPPPPSFEVYVQPNPADTNTIYELNYGAWTRDPTSGAVAFTYDVNALPAGTLPAVVAKVANLRELYRAVVINPEEGTVKFFRPPDTNAIVFAKYRPKAYRLTDDPAADVSPCAVADYNPNLRYMPNNPPGNPFILPSSNWNPDSAPPTDRLWVLWRRPGVGICYKTLRYVAQLNYQVALKPGTFEPAIGSIQGLGQLPSGGTALTYPVEVDWTRNRLYFAMPDSIAMNGKIPIPNQVEISYTDASGNSRTETQIIQLTDEEMGPSGKTFGNLTNLMVNESQVSAFKDPWDNKLWVFWTSTRSGNPDIYYETISPMFYGKQYGAASP